MIRHIYENAALVDTSAVVAALDHTDSNHNDAKRFLKENVSLPLFALDVTSHECFTRVRYKSHYAQAQDAYVFLRQSSVELVRFQKADEGVAEVLLKKYSEHAISFHDALCAAAMKRLGLYKVFTFDKDFAILGFLPVPGYTA